jgi:hypothetical protein
MTGCQPKRAASRIAKRSSYTIATQLPLRPNPSLKLTRYGRRCKPGLRHTVHLLSPGLQRLPPRAA